MKNAYLAEDLLTKFGKTWYKILKIQRKKKAQLPN